MAAVAADGSKVEESFRFVPVAPGLNAGNYYRNTETNEIVWHRHEDQTVSFYTAFMEGQRPEEIFMTELYNKHLPVEVETAIVTKRSSSPPQVPSQVPPQASLSIYYKSKDLRPTRATRKVRTDRKRAKECRSKRFHKSERKKAKFAKNVVNGVSCVDWREYKYYGMYMRTGHIHHCRYWNDYPDEDFYG